MGHWSVEGCLRALDAAVAADMTLKAMRGLMDWPHGGNVRAGESIRLRAVAGDLPDAPPFVLPTVSVPWPASTPSRPSPPLAALAVPAAFARVPTAS